MKAIALNEAREFGGSLATLENMLVDAMQGSHMPSGRRKICKILLGAFVKNSANEPAH